MAPIRRILRLACRTALLGVVCAVAPSAATESQFELETIGIVAHEGFTQIDPRQASQTCQPANHLDAHAAGMRGPAASSGFAGRRISATRLAPLRC
jgi:hypothetical protein